VEQPHLHDYSQHSPHNRGSDPLVDTYNQRLREVAARYTSVVLCRVESWNALTMIAADTVHPNDLGHREIARAAYDAAVVRSRP
jgi:lysophospholipase L1-like esterase